MDSQILVINGGSSSIKFALFVREGVRPLLSGGIERIGLDGSMITLMRNVKEKEERQIPIPDTQAAMALLFQTISTAPETKTISAIGHRIVHGMHHEKHELITPPLREELRGREHLDPEHLPFENALIDASIAAYPSIPQFACFDTVFHRSIPRVASILPIPRKYFDAGIKKYGFHGLSCEYIVEELRLVDPRTAAGRLIIAHLGSGSSITAVRGGQSIDTTMGFTPTGGIPMSSRAGDLDPGTMLHIARSEHMTNEQVGTMISHQSGLLGISGVSADMHDLLMKEGEDTRAKEAIDVFCYEAKKRIAGYAGVLGGVDALIFVGGIGERSELIRKRICAGLEWMGISASDPSRVRVMHTNEELMMARIVARMM